MDFMKTSRSHQLANGPITYNPQSREMFSILSRSIPEGV